MMSLVWDLSSLGSSWDSQEHLPATIQKFRSSYVSQSSCSIIFDLSLGCCAVMNLEEQMARSTLPWLHCSVQFWVFALYPNLHVKALTENDNVYMALRA